MKRFAVILAVMMCASTAECIKIGFESSKSQAVVTLCDGHVVKGLTNLPREKTKEIRLRRETGDTVVQAVDIDSMVVKSAKYESDNSFVLKYSQFHDHPGGKLHKPLWMVRRIDGEHVDLWWLARKPFFGLSGELRNWVGDYGPLNLFWKKTDRYPILIYSRKEVARFFSDDPDVADLIVNQKDYYYEHIPGDYEPKVK